MSTAIALGSKVKDCVSGFAGVVTARCEYAWGNTRIEVQSTALNAEGRCPSEWIDEARLEIVA